MGNVKSFWASIVRAFHASDTLYYRGYEPFPAVAVHAMDCGFAGVVWHGVAVPIYKTDLLIDVLNRWEEMTGK